MTQIDMTARALADLRPRTAAQTRPENVTQALEALAAMKSAPQVGVLKDRTVPGRRTALDWLLVGAFGVLVVDEHPVEGDGAVTVRVRASSGSDVPWTVVADGHDHPRALSGALTRRGMVLEVLEAAGLASVEVTAVVCFDRAALPPMRRQLRLGDCIVVGLPGLSRLTRTSGKLAATDLPRVLSALEEAFPPAPTAVPA